MIDSYFITENILTKNDIQKIINRVVAVKAGFKVFNFSNIFFFTSTYILIISKIEFN